MQQIESTIEQFIFKTAIRENTPMIIGISGASGSGKTFTALELAMGLAGKRKIAFIDTEGRRALHYADLGRFRFDHLDFAAPYTPARFLEALKQASEAGYAVVIVDSFSDEYVGEGGLVDMANAQLERVKNTAASWAVPKAQHKLVIRWLRQSRCHVIFCLRAEEKVRLEKVVRNNREQTVVVPIGWQPICEKGVPYEMTTSFLLTPDAPGIPKPIKIQEQHRSFFPLDRPVTRETGVRLAAWCAGGAPAPAPPPTQRQQEVSPPNGPVLDDEDPFGWSYDTVNGYDDLPMSQVTWDEPHKEGESQHRSAPQPRNESFGDSAPKTRGEPIHKGVPNKGSESSRRGAPSPTSESKSQSVPTPAGDPKTKSVPDHARWEDTVFALVGMIEELKSVDEIREFRVVYRNSMQAMSKEYDDGYRQILTKLTEQELALTGQK